MPLLRSTWLGLFPMTVTEACFPRAASPFPQGNVWGHLYSFNPSISHLAPLLIFALWRNWAQVSLRTNQTHTIVPSLCLSLCKRTSESLDNSCTLCLAFLSPQAFPDGFSSASQTAFSLTLVSLTFVSAPNALSLGSSFPQPPVFLPTFSGPQTTF